MKIFSYFLRLIPNKFERAAERLRRRRRRIKISKGDKFLSFRRRKSKRMPIEKNFFDEREENLFTSNIRSEVPDKIFLNKLTADRRMSELLSCFSNCSTAKMI